MVYAECGFCCRHSPIWDMNARIFRVQAMECMCVQTRPWFILSYEFFGNWFRTYVKSKENSPLRGAQRRVEPATLHHAGRSPSQYRLSYSGPVLVVKSLIWLSQGQWGAIPDLPHLKQVPFHWAINVTGGGKCWSSSHCAVYIPSFHCLLVLTLTVVSQRLKL